MACFEYMFRETDGPVIYNGILIDQIDRFPVKNGDILICSIEEAIKKKDIFKDFALI